MSLDSFILEVFDKEEKGDNSLSVGKELRWVKGYIEVEEIGESVGGFEDGETVIELWEEVTFDLLEWGVFVVEDKVKFL